ncbi:uncharacterized protein LOC130553235 isoform X2 [Triplophysa rosa]|uniref:uncharacterized protein LOC130553235 isoform X2 n=1 Tax=Triplophysa rosa TaxID=992332 RepID=UPI0025460207|nr:uncharacterized protein LOC130553235 isoform X2 [Triplophysa rosa]
MSEYRPTLHPDFFTPAYNSLWDAFDEVEEMDDGGDGANAAGADEESDIIYIKQLRGGRHPIDLNVSSDINNKLLKKETWKIKKEVLRKPTMHLASADINMMDVIGIIDTFDRPGDAYTEDTYARCGTHAVAFEDEPGKRLPKAGAQCEAGVGRARAEFSVFEAEAKGPNASAGAEASVGALGASAMARAEVASVCAKAGPVGVKVGLGVDTGVSVGLGGFEAKFLGFGFTIGPKTSISLLGSEVSCSVM